MVRVMISLISVTAALNVASIASAAPVGYIPMAATEQQAVPEFARNELSSRDDAQGFDVRDTSNLGAAFQVRELGNNIRGRNLAARASNDVHLEWDPDTRNTGGHIRPRYSIQGNKDKQQRSDSAIASDLSKRWTWSNKNIAIGLGSLIGAGYLWNKLTNKKTEKIQRAG
ncbi:hypothetical protein AMATHDRAFT_67400 [Amanita thiersii Skay4041]|uniref:Uncharacterized protein n=1 Tax=Amanita thiersii Skay4041 TaxID=703135 RepID=A0A2A9NE72_9AGAR|nr:hypothetical protein AMATHDRAFT_67400 [Amanita thiersii Skay4041]